MLDKNEVFPMFMAFFAMVNRQFSQTVKIVQSDNSTELKCLIDYFTAIGIIFQTSCVGTPQQNGRVERKHKHILSVARALRFQAQLPIYFWGECVLAAAHLINRTPTPLLQNKTPFEILFHKPPVFNVIRTFGCLCFAHNQKTNGDKFASKSRKCVFMGYPFGKKGWNLYDLESKEFLVSRDVKFIEDVFPFGCLEDVNVGSNIVEHGDIHEDFCDLGSCDDNCDIEGQGIVRNGYESGIPQLTVQQSPQAQPTTTSVPTHPVAPDTLLAEAHSGSAAPSSVVATNDISGTDNMERGFRTKFPSVKLRDHVTASVFAKSQSPSLPAPSSDHTSGTLYPLAYYIHCDNFSVHYRKFIAAIINGTDPKSFKEAMKHAGWQKSMQEEIQALEAYGTWTLEPLPPGKKDLGSQ